LPVIVGKITLGQKGWCGANYYSSFIHHKGRSNKQRDK